MEIDELPRENILKAQIASLTSSVEDLEGKVDYLVIQNEKLAIQNEYSKFVIVMQDFNSSHKLEQDPELLPDIRKNLRKLRGARVAAYHYILDDDSDSLLEYV